MNSKLAADQLAITLTDIHEAAAVIDGDRVSRTERAYARLLLRHIFDRTKEVEEYLRRLS